MINLSPGFYITALEPSDAPWVLHPPWVDFWKQNFSCICMHSITNPSFSLYRHRKTTGDALDIPIFIIAFSTHTSKNLFPLGNFTCWNPITVSLSPSFPCFRPSLQGFTIKRIPIEACTSLNLNLSCTHRTCAQFHDSDSTRRIQVFKH